MPDESPEQELEPVGVAPSIIAHVYLWANGWVMVFDQDGRQLPSYQGNYAEVKARILADAPAEASFHRSAYGLATKDITRREFGEGAS